MLKMLILFFMFFNFIYGQQSKNKMRVAIIDLNPVGISSTTAIALSDILRTEIFNTGAFEVLERAQINNVLKEQEFQLSGCTETECAVQIGQLLSAHKVLVGTVSKIGDSFIINARIVDVEKGTLEFADKYVASSENELIYGCEWFAKKLAAKMKGEKFVEPVPSYKVEKPSTYQKIGEPKKQVKSEFHGLLHLWFGLGKNGSIDLRFSNTFPNIYKSHLGLEGNFPEPFNSIEWKDLKSKDFKSFGLSWLISFGQSCLFGGVGLDLFFTRFKIDKQLTKFYLNDEYAGDFEFTTSDYFNMYTFYDGFDIFLSYKLWKIFTPYIILSGGLTFNGYDAPTIMGYTDYSSVFKSPSKENFILGLGWFISFGFDFTLIKSFGIFVEARHLGNWFSFDRGIEYEKDEHTVTAQMFISGISFAY